MCVNKCDIMCDVFVKPAFDSLVRNACVMDVNSIICPPPPSSLPLPPDLTGFA